MSIADNKHIVQLFCGHFGTGDIAAVLNMMADDATWWVNGKPHLFSGAGLKSKADMAALWSALYAQLDNGLQMHILSMIAEDDRVAAEIRSYGPTTAGKVYENDYHFLFRIRGGKIVEVREYGDMMHAVEVFG